MCIGEQLVDSVEIILSGYGVNGKVKLGLMERMNELKEKHASLLEKTNVPPVFYLGNIPDSVPDFRSLKDLPDKQEG